MSDLTRRELLGSMLIAAAAGLKPAAVTALAASAPHNSIATTRAGKVGGARVDGVHVFKGVPYGADTRMRRFRTGVAAALMEGRARRAGLRTFVSASERTRTGQRGLLTPERLDAGAA